MRKQLWSKIALFAIALASTLLFTQEASAQRFSIGVGGRNGFFSYSNRPYYGGYGRGYGYNRGYYGGYRNYYPYSSGVSIYAGPTYVPSPYYGGTGYVVPGSVYYPANTGYLYGY